MNKPEIGDAVIYTDEVGVDHNALIQCVWSDTCVNFVFISGDENKKDSYGRQIEHKTSMQHVSKAGAYGFYWRWPGEERNPYQPPQAV